MQKSRRVIGLCLPLAVVVLILSAGCKSAPSNNEGGPGVKDFFTGVANIFIISEDGSLWTAGYNRSGQLGLEGSGAPGLVEIKADGAAFTGVKSVAAGENHTFILKDDGTLWAAGESLYGELGLGGDGKAKLPQFTRLEITGVKSAAAGNNSTFIVKDDGTLWAAGYNYYGELGLGDRENRAEFTQVSSAGNDVKAVSAGARHTLILKNDGTVWGAGYNFNGQLGLGSGDDSPVFVRVESINADAAAVAAGNYHSVILKNDGTVWTAGENYHGQLGWDDKTDRNSFTQVQDNSGGLIGGVKEIAARGNISLILKNDNTLLLAGSYADPEPRDEFQLPPEETVSSEAKSSFAPLEVEKSRAEEFNEIRRIVLGNQGVYIVTDDNRLWAAGSNRYGQLALDYDTVLVSSLQPVYP